MSEVQGKSSRYAPRRNVRQESGDLLPSVQERQHRRCRNTDDFEVTHVQAVLAIRSSMP